MREQALELIETGANADRLTRFEGSANQGVYDPACPFRVVSALKTMAPRGTEGVRRGFFWGCRTAPDRHEMEQTMPETTDTDAKGSPSRRGAKTKAEPTNTLKLMIDVSAVSALKEFCGSDNEEFNQDLLNTLLRTAWMPKGIVDPEYQQKQIAMLAALKAFKPADEVEGMLAVQALAAHHASMECSRRAMVPDQPFEAAQGFRKAAVNASRNFIELLAALDRKRGKGQVVRVERVVVNEGGKAIVGNVSGGAPADATAAPPLAIGHEAPGITLGDLIGPQRELVKAPLSGEGGGV
jgi:hypothetical protein